MKERPILFSGPMVQAILAGRKTQTRRVVKPQPKHTDSWTTLRYYGEGIAIECGPDYPDDHDDQRICPYGVPGDTLWVRETWGAPDCDRPGVVGGRQPAPGDRIVYQADEADAWQWRSGMPWLPSIHMPRWASRITLEIKAVRVERLQEISEEDAKAEGAERAVVRPGKLSSYVDAFAVLWSTINHPEGPDSWTANPWVWVIEFEREAP